MLKVGSSLTKLVTNYLMKSFFGAERQNRLLKSNKKPWPCSPGERKFLFRSWSRLSLDPKKWMQIHNPAPGYLTMTLNKSNITDAGSFLPTLAKNPGSGWLQSRNTVPAYMRHFINVHQKRAYYRYTSISAQPCKTDGRMFCTIHLSRRIEDVPLQSEKYKCRNNLRNQSLNILIWP